MSKVIFASDLFVEQHGKGGAELTTEAIIEGAQNLEIQKVLCNQITTELVDSNRDAFWIFGNFFTLKDDVKFHIMKNLQLSLIHI